MADIEDHLNVTIQQVGTDVKVPMDDFDGKVVYGQKRQNLGQATIRGPFLFFFTLQNGFFFCDEFSVKDIFVIGSSYENHVSQMAPTVQELSGLEHKAQHIFINRYYLKDKSWMRST